MPRGAAVARGGAMDDDITVSEPPIPSTAGAAAAYLSTSRRLIDMSHRI
jgi:hypothetical protein